MRRQFAPVLLALAVLACERPPKNCSGEVAVSDVPDTTPTVSWTPPPERFASAERAPESPSWSKSRGERGGTVVWFYVEMSRQDALPVLLRALDHGQTWLQAKAVMELAGLDIDFPPDFKRKAVKFYDSIDLGGLSADRTELSAADEDRLGLKGELAFLILKFDRTRGEMLLEQLAQAAPQEYVRALAQEALRSIRDGEAVERERQPSRSSGRGQAK